MPNDLNHDETQLYDRYTATSVAVRVPPSAISSCIRTPPWLAVLTMVGILLAVTDIPRTGSSYIPRDIRKKVAPGVAMYWGPYEYHVGHLQLQVDNSTTASSHVPAGGTRNGEKLEHLDAWSYKQDTLSIAPRAIAGHLNVTSYPACLLYREQCQSARLELATAFTMLDGLIQEIETGLFSDPTLETKPFSFTTWSNWVDRLHHRVYLAFGRNPEMRSHDLYHLSARNGSANGRHIDPLHLCGATQDRHGQPPSFASHIRPIFCDDPIMWRCTHPTNSTSDRLVPLWEHVAIRLADLQRQYPGIDLDLTMFITTLKEKSQGNEHILPSISFVTDALEITTLIRGRRCHVDNGCRTVFIDDYRYERAVIESDEEEWAFYVVILRWSSQVYVWIRVWCLLMGCYCARERDPEHGSETIRSRLIATSTILVKIPAHTIVYGSWIPIIGYSFAHFCDSSLVQTIGQFAWSSVGGYYVFHPVEYVITASVQMRNIWMIALLWKIVSSGHEMLHRFRPTSKFIGLHSILALRGGWFGFISWLTTFGLMRALHYRDTNIVRFLALSGHNAMSAVHVQRNQNHHGFQFDAKCSFAAAVFVFSAGWFFQKLVRWATGRHSSMFVCRSFYVPHSAGTLWPRSQLATFWLVRFHTGRNTDNSCNSARVYTGTTSTFPQLGPQVDCLASPPSASTTRAPRVPFLKSRACRLCGFQPSIIHWRATQGCPRHEPILDIHRRTKPLWSMVRLMNIANMTEPVALFRLYVTGRPLYVYRVISGDQAPYCVLLPMKIECRDENTVSSTPRMHPSIQCGSRDSGSDVKFELRQIVDSRDVPWHVLVTCG